MRYEDLDVIMPLQRIAGMRRHPYFGARFIGTEWDDKLQAQVFNFDDPKFHLKVSVVFKDGELYVSSEYGDTMKLSDFSCTYDGYEW